MRWRLVLLPVLLTACGGAVIGTPPDKSLPSRKVFVCKYVTKPGEDERLQTGDNPISVSVNSLVGPNVDINIGDSFQDGQERSVVIAFDVGQPEPSVSECPSPNTPPTTTAAPTTEATTTSVVTTNPTGGTTTTTGAPTSTTTTTTTPTTTTSGPSTSTSTTTTLPPTSTSAAPTTTTSLPPTTTSTTTSTTTTSPSSTPPSTSSVPPTTSSGTTTTTLPPTFQFAGATTVCIVEVPTIQIIFGNALPQLAGHVGTLTMTALNGTPVSTQPLTYQPNTTVNLLYPGTRVNPDGTIADVPGWNLTSDGFWVRDPTDAFLRDGIVLTYTVNPTATATVTYPPESSACANPKGPFPPGVTTIPGGSTTLPGGPTTMPDELPPTGSDTDSLVIALVTLMAGAGIVLTARKRRTV